MFLPSPNNRASQRFCSLPACRKASKVRSQRKWRQKNPGYDTGPENVDRVRQWRERNPGYGRARKSPLREIAPIQPADPVLVAQSEISPKSPDSPALQDLALSQSPLFVGLISAVLGDALQESFVPLTRQLVERGRRLLASFPDGAGDFCAAGANR